MYICVIMKYFTYILFSEKTNKYYIGYTSNINTRLDKHNLGGTTSTRSGRPWKLMYYETYSNKTEAIKREKEIKNKKSRKYIEYLIHKDG